MTANKTKVSLADLNGSIPPHTAEQVYLQRAIDRVVNTLALAPLSKREHAEVDQAFVMIMEEVNQKTVLAGQLKQMQATATPKTEKEKAKQE